MARTSVLIDPPLKRKAQRRCLDEGLSLSKVIRELLKLWLDGKVVIEGQNGSP